jgi:hypothetical protein
LVGEVFTRCQRTSGDGSRSVDVIVHTAPLRSTVSVFELPASSSAWPAKL